MVICSMFPAESTFSIGFVIGVRKEVVSRELVDTEQGVLFITEKKLHKN